MRIPPETGAALAHLLSERVIGYDALVDLAVGLSRKGHSRREIVDFFYLVALKFQHELADDALDMIGDLNHHIAGDQCALDQIVPLHGDPTDRLELANLVSREMKGWTPPTDW